MKICVDTGGLISKSEEITAICNDLNIYMNQIENVVLSLNGEWQGDAERAYSAQLIFIRKQFSDIVGFLEEYARLLETFSDEYEDFDKELSTKINLA